MAEQRNINTGGGNYNESISGTYIQGNYIRNYVSSNPINLQQDFDKIATDIQSYIVQSQAKGCSLAEAQQQIVQELVNKAQNDPSLKTRLIQLGKYLSNAATSGLIGEGAIEVVKIVLRLLGSPF